MLRAAFLTLNFVAAAVPVSADLSLHAPTSRVDQARVIQAHEVFAANDCKMAENDVEKVFNTNGFNDKAEMRAIVAQLLFDDMLRVVDLEENGQTIVGFEAYEGNCNYGPSHGLTMVIQEMVASSGCQIHARDSLRILKSWGIFEGEFKAVLPLMIEADMISLSDDEKVVYVSLEDCLDIAVPIGDAFVESWELEEPLNSQRDAVVTLFENAGCSMTYSDAKAQFQSAGHTWSHAAYELAGMVGVGEAVVMAPDQRIILKTGACA